MLKRLLTFCAVAVMALCGYAEKVELTADMFCRWDGYGANATVTATNVGEYHIGESSGLPYGNGNVEGSTYADLSAYKALLLTVTEGTPRLLINRQSMDNSGNFIEINSASSPYVVVEDGVWTINLGKIVGEAGYAHLNCIKGANWANCTITEAWLENDIEIVEPEPWVCPEGEVDITTLPWVNNGQGCFIQFGKDLGNVFGTDAGGGNLSYVDITEYSAIKIYGEPSSIRAFINRSEFSDGTFQFHATIGEDGVAIINTADVLEAQPEAKYVHLNGIKAGPSYDSKCTVYGISLVPVVKGTEDNPIDLSDCVAVEVAASNDYTYFCYTAPADGKVQFNLGGQTYETLIDGEYQVTGFSMLGTPVTKGETIYLRAKFTKAVTVKATYSEPVDPLAYTTDYNADHTKVTVTVEPNPAGAPMFLVSVNGGEKKMVQGAPVLVYEYDEDLDIELNGVATGVVTYTIAVEQANYNMNEPTVIEVSVAKPAPADGVVGTGIEGDNTPFAGTKVKVETYADHIVVRGWDGTEGSDLYVYYTGVAFNDEILPYQITGIEQRVDGEVVSEFVEEEEDPESSYVILHPQSEEYPMAAVLPFYLMDDEPMTRLMIDEDGMGQLMLFGMFQAASNVGGEDDNMGVGEPIPTAYVVTWGVPAVETPLYEATAQTSVDNDWESEDQTAHMVEGDLHVVAYDGYVIIKNFDGVKGYDLKVAFDEEETATAITVLHNGEETDATAAWAWSGAAYWYAYTTPGSSYAGSDAEEKSGYAIISAYVGNDYIYYYVAWGPNDADAIASVKAAKSGAIYNIAGQQVEKATKGIYIINGKKVVVK